MVTHVVLFRFPDGADIDGVVRRLRSMERNVGTLRHLEVGRDENGSERAWDVCLLTRFDSAADLDAYQADPFHQEVAAFIREQGSESAVVDWTG